MDLIDREQAIKEIRREVSEQENTAIQGEDIDIGVIVGLKIAAQIIKKQPSVEKTGKWLYYLDNGRRRCKCSNCLTSYGCLDTPYCPNCGFKMEG